MYEEVPRHRRGPARLLARHGLEGVVYRQLILGPFAVGAGALLTVFGGSVAIAATATVLTAHSATLHVLLAPLDGRKPHSPNSASDAAPASPPASPATSSAATGPTAPAPARVPSMTPNPLRLPQGAPGWGPAHRSKIAASMTAGSAATVTSVAPSSDPTPSLVPVADPAGNAVVFIHGYIPQTNRIEFSYAHRAGTTGTDLFLRDSTKTYSAGIASGLTITSGTLLCPPVGSGCTIDQLTEATTTGFFADVGIDPAGDLRSVIERDNLPAGSDTNAASAAPTPTGSRAAPTASAGTAPAGGTPASATTAASPSDTASAD